MAAPGVPLLTLEDRLALPTRGLCRRITDPKTFRSAIWSRCELTRWAMRSCQARLARSCRPLIRQAAVTLSRSICLLQRALRSGSFGRARFSSGQKQAITIPRRAITERGQLISVFVVDESGIARLRLIKTGKIYGDRIEVLTGLSDGERIVVDRVEAVSDGSRVESI